MTTADYHEAASRLCTACGMCCNGVLFHIVRLQPGDSAKQLEAHGMQLSRRKREPYFKQPCTALDGCICTLYNVRPQRCRMFECRQLKRLAGNSTTEDEAMQVIETAKRSVAAVEQLLKACGNTAAHLPLAERSAQVLADGAGEGGQPSPQQQALANAMQALDALLNAEFRLERV